MSTYTELKEKIIKTGYLENKKVGMNFSKQYPILFKEINQITKELETTFFVNTYLRARIIFLFKYDNNIHKIKKDNSWLTFDRKIDDFIDKTGNYVKRGWNKIKNNLDAEIYTKDETIKLLSENDLYKKYLGKSKNRTLIKEQPKLYQSIFEHTKLFNSFNKNENKFSVRMLFLVKDNGEEENIKCKNCKDKYTSFNYSIGYFNPLCLECFTFSDTKYPNKGWFKDKYGENWESEYNLEMENRYPKAGWFKDKYGENWEVEYENYNKFTVNSKAWYQNKYGEIEGLNKYITVTLNRVHNINNLKSKKYSNISQSLFWKIYNNLNNKEQSYVFFKLLNKEQLFINKNEGRFFFADFTFKNKIIEYDGKYWHPKDNEKDIIRNKTYKSLGYEVLILNEDDYSDTNESDDTLQKCLKFLRNEL